MVKYGLTFIVGLLILIAGLVVLTPIAEDNSWIAPDTFFHFIGGIFAAWCARLISPKVSAVIIGAMVIGVWWEVAEHASSYFGPTYWPVIASYFYGGGIIDTISDLIADLVGAIVFVLVYFRYEAQKNNR